MLANKMNNMNQKDKNRLNELTEAELDWIKTITSNTCYESLTKDVENIQSNFIDYLTDAKFGIQDCKLKCKDWTCRYNDTLFKNTGLLNDKINVDAEEFLLSLDAEEMSDEDDGKFETFSLNLCRKPAIH